MGGGSVMHKVLFRNGWRHIFCMPGFENVSPVDGFSFHCVVKVEWKFIFLWFYNFLFFSFVFYYILCVIYNGGL